MYAVCEYFNANNQCLINDWLRKVMPNDHQHCHECVCSTCMRELNPVTKQFNCYNKKGVRACYGAELRKQYTKT